MVGAVALYGHPQISNVVASSVTHSSVLLEWTVSARATKSRIRYGTTTQYEAGPNGGIQMIRTSGVITAGQTMAGLVSGLMPGQTYHFCPGASADGTTWSQCVDFQQKLPEAPSTHPAYPTPPVMMDTSYPDTTAWQVLHVAADCSNLQIQLDAAARAQATGSALVLIPAGTNCTGNYYVHSSGDYRAVSVSAINGSTGVWRVPNHGFTNQQRVRVSSYAGGADNGAMPCGLVPGNDYYVDVIDANTFVLTPTRGGAAIAAGLCGAYGTQYITAWPPNSNHKVVLRTATPDNEFVPPGVRVSPVWKPKMATFTAQVPDSMSNRSLSFYSVHDWRIIGIEVTHADLAQGDMQSTTDPRSFERLMWSGRENHNIIIDRCYLHGLGYPNRVLSLLTFWDGDGMAVMNSYLEKLDAWHPAATNMERIRIDSRHIKINAGSITAGPLYRYKQVVPTTMAFSGTGSCSHNYGDGSGCGTLYAAMDGTLHVRIPSGMSAACNGSSCTVENGTGYPKDVHGRIAGMLLAAWDFHDGAVESFQVFDGLSTGFTEGCSAVISGLGPGPFLWDNNFIGGSGILIHFDDSIATSRGAHSKYPVHADFTLHRNHFYTDAAMTALHGFGGGTLYYGHRNQLEWKDGWRIKVDGNIFEGSIADVHQTGSVVIMPVHNSVITDVEFANNTIRDGGLGILLAGPIDTQPTMGPALQRAWVHNNLLIHNKGLKYNDMRSHPHGAADIQFMLSFAMEDVRIEHNTLYDNRGSNPFPISVQEFPSEGMSVRDNFFWVNAHQLVGTSDSQLPGQTPLCNQMDKALLDCMWTPSYTFKWNVLLAGWPESATPSGQQSSSWLRSALGHLASQNRILKEPHSASGVDLPLSIAEGHSSSDQERAGVDVIQLERAQGVISNIGAFQVTAKEAIISANVPGRRATCIVGYGTSLDPITWKRSIGDTEDDYARRISISGLRESTVYYYSVWCAGAPPSPTSKFQTGYGDRSQ
jgi:hypothetical protein